MTVLFGHPTGNPNSHNAALAHFEAGWLEAFCVPWMPTEGELTLLGGLPGMTSQVARLRRRRFAPLDRAPKVQLRIGEWSRMLRRLIGGAWADERLAYEANDWLMSVMARECRRSAVTAVHSYEDCSFDQFREAAKTGKARIYDLPIGYYPAWESTLARLSAKYDAWRPNRRSMDTKYVRPEQKRAEMELAELVLVPCSFVKRTVEAHVDRKVEVAAYGVDCEFWRPDRNQRAGGPLRFLYSGQCSIRKGVPMLIEAWRSAALKDAVLDIVGQWQLTTAVPGGLPKGIRIGGPLSPDQLRLAYQRADVFVFPSNFEGFGLVMLEAMACGLPVIASDATAGPDVLDETNGWVIAPDDLDALVAALRQAATGRDRIRSMGLAARDTARAMSWEGYRTRVSQATASLVTGQQASVA